jgi:hypothetical protein
MICLHPGFHAQQPQALQVRQSQAVIETSWKFARHPQISTCGAQQLVHAAHCAHVAPVGQVAPVGPAGPCGPALHIAVQTLDLQERGVPEDSFDTVPFEEHAVPVTTVSVI